jgi:iron-sulfur cluster assembly protein
MITISNEAKNKITNLLNDQNLDDTYFLRVGVKGSGCAGLSYTMDFDNNLNDKDEIFENNGVKVVCDMKSILYLSGSTLEFSDGLNGKGLYFNNPNSTRTCGCGESFSI